MFVYNPTPLLPFSEQIRGTAPERVCCYLEYLTKYEENIYEFIKLYENIVKINMETVKKIWSYWSVFL